MTDTPERPEALPEGFTQKLKELAAEVQAYKPTQAERQAAVELVREAEEAMAWERRERLAEEASRETDHSVMARMRARRANYLRKLLKQFPYYAEFDAPTAALKTKLQKTDMENYLLKESALKGSRIVERRPGFYCIVGEFD